MGTNTLLPLVTIIPALIGSGLISAGFIIHPLITINPKERGLTSKDISIWQVTGKAFIYFDCFEFLGRILSELTRGH